MNRGYKLTAICAQKLRANRWYIVGPQQTPHIEASEFESLFLVKFERRSRKRVAFFSPDPDSEDQNELGADEIVYHHPDPLFNRFLVLEQTPPVPALATPTLQCKQKKLGLSLVTCLNTKEKYIRWRWATLADCDDASQVEKDDFPEWCAVSTSSSPHGDAEYLSPSKPHGIAEDLWQMLPEMAQKTLSASKKRTRSEDMSNELC